MKKYLFLTFCSIIVIFETYTTAISIPIVDKNLSSKTKEINEIQWNNSLAQVEEST